jgi:type II secretory pathway component GspD/PulD (secretin)
LAPLERQDQLVHKPRASAVWWACAFLALTGCRTFARIPPPQPKTIEELYYEAQAAAKPEVNLGLDHPLRPELHEVVSSPPTASPPPGDPNLPTYQAPAEQPPQLQPVPSGTGIPAIPPAQPPAPPLPDPPPPAARAPGTVTPVLHSAPATAPSGVVPASSSMRVSETFEQTDVREAIQVIANQVQASVVLDDTVRGEVSCTITDEPFEQALQKLLLPLGFVYRYKDNRYLIGSNDPASNLFPMIAESIEFRPNHLSAQELIALLPSRHTPFVRNVEKRNLIVIEAPHDAAQQILSQLQNADQPVPQIMIEAVVCVVQPDKGLQFGMDWNHILKVQGVDAFNVGMTGLAFNGAASPNGANNAFDDFAVTSAFVKLLAKEGYVSIRAAPRVMAKDGEKADISIARDTFFSIQQGNNQFLFRQDIEKVESGISLTLTPTIRGDNVQVVIEKAEVSEDIRTIDSSQDLTNNPFPIINRRRVTTTVQVKDRQTIAIGGLVGRQMVERELRIPVLSRAPGIGRAFRKIERQEQDAEVVIFISPKIVVPTAQPSSCPLPEGSTPLTTFPAVPVTATPMAAPAEVPAMEAATPVIPNLRVVPGD